ncbi:MerR family transcriptional regulator [Pelagibacteraceae bacterium]|nr:MerR family transcriptional regulator [Pelagibacteraceae bacterium]
MIHKKTYYSISEVSKMLNIQEHTIRFWDSKLPDISKRDKKGKTRFFSLKQIEKLSKLNDILKKNDSITLAYEILSKNNNKKSSININNNDYLKTDSIEFQKNIHKIKNISRSLKNLLN